MKRKNLVLLLTPFLLAGCAKTDLLYKENAYNSPVFDENYYTSWDGIDSLSIRNEDINELQYDKLDSQDKVDGRREFSSVDGLSGLRYEDTLYQTSDGLEESKWFDMDQNNMFGYKNNLSSIEKKFNYGVLSKLYDGRVRCDGYYQKSRVQLNKSGYATYFPKSLVESKYIAFACRGGSSPSNSPLTSSDKKALIFNINVSFYIHISNSTQYDKVTFKLENVPVQSDNGGGTNLVSFYLPNTSYLKDAVAMSLNYNVVSDLSTYNMTDDYNDKEKDHMALMLYEVFIGKSSWF